MDLQEACDEVWQLRCQSAQSAETALGSTLSGQFDFDRWISSSSKVVPRAASKLVPRAAFSRPSIHRILSTAIERPFRTSTEYTSSSTHFGPFRFRPINTPPSLFSHSLSILTPAWVLFRTRTASFELELELSRTGVQWPFRRKAPIGNKVAKLRHRLSTNSLRLSSGFLVRLERPPARVLFRTRTASLNNSNCLF